jgi:hypothetical protein
MEAEAVAAILVAVAIVRVEATMGLRPEQTLVLAVGCT